MDRNDRVLITGATGFIGGRLVEFLASLNARIRVATSDFRHCSRVARFPIELVKANLLDHAALVEAVAGCNVVVHLAYKFGGSTRAQMRANLDGTRALAEAFLRNGGRRFVHVSSIAAYGAPFDGDLTENVRHQPTRDAYSNTKLKIEQLLRGLHQTHGLPVTIVQPTIVYGPYGSTWTTRLLEQVRSNRIALPNGGSGLCNAVYVDDVVSACVLAVENDSAVGETFLISGESPTTWREFYGAYEKMLGKRAVLDIDDQKISVEERNLRRKRSPLARLGRELARRRETRQYLLSLPPLSWLVAGAELLPEKAHMALRSQYQSFWRQQVSSDRALPLYVPDAHTRALYVAKTRVHINKARNILRYKPAFDLDSGMALTKHWAEWANLIPAELK